MDQKMYLANPEKLAEQWKANAVSSKMIYDYLIYWFLVSAISTVLGGIIQASGDNAATSPKSLFAVIVVAVVQFGVSYLIISWLNNKNGGSDGNNFLNKLLSLYLNISIQLAPFMIIALILMMVFKTNLFVLMMSSAALVGIAIYSLIRVGKLIEEIRIHELPKVEPGIVMTE